MTKEEYNKVKFDPTTTNNMEIFLYNNNLAICALLDVNGHIIRTIDVPLENAKRHTSPLTFFLVLFDDFKVQRKKSKRSRTWKSIYDILIENNRRKK